MKSFQIFYIMFKRILGKNNTLDMIDQLVTSIEQKNINNVKKALKIMSDMPNHLVIYVFVDPYSSINLTIKSNYLIVNKDGKMISIINTLRKSM